MTQRILGYVMAKNEWPILGLSISHALLRGVDEILVVDHCSNDGTRAGLVALQQRFPNRIEVLRLDLPEYLQEATTALVSSLINVEQYDWVYIFDADEFMLGNQKSDLGEVLEGIPLEVQGVRYKIDQWVAPFNFNDEALGSYTQICQKATPVLFSEPPVEILENEIREGNMNFFDFDFPSKLIIRSNQFFNAGPGAHSLRNGESSREVMLSKSELVCAHLPLLGKRRILLRSSQGKSLVERGFPSWHGWQSQMVFRLDTERRLEAFWENHSISMGKEISEITGSRPKTETSLDFSLWIRNTIDSIEDLQHIAPVALVRSSASITNQPIHWGLSVPALHKALRERDSLLSERDSLLSERDSLLSERDSLLSERDSLLSERDSLLSERDSLLKSRSWKITSGFRAVWRFFSVLR
jgi:hypothetical protein